MKKLAGLTLIGALSLTGCDIVPRSEPLRDEYENMTTVRSVNTVLYDLCNGDQPRVNEAGLRTLPSDGVVDLITDGTIAARNKVAMFYNPECKTALESLNGMLGEGAQPFTPEIQNAANELMRAERNYLFALENDAYTRQQERIAQRAQK